MEKCMYWVVCHALLISVRCGCQASGDDGMHYMVEPNDAKSFYQVNTVIVKVSTEFLFIDDSNLEKPGINYYPGDFLLNEPIFIYDFIPYNSTLRIEGGYAVELYRAYMP